MSRFAIFILVASVAIFSTGCSDKKNPGSKCRLNLLSIGLALEHYRTTYGHYPPAYIPDENGKPMHSWRVLILPFLEEGELWGRYDFKEPWDGPNNSKLHDIIVPAYACPTNLNKMATYLAVVGPKSAWQGVKTRKLEELKGGDQKLIFLAEVADSGIHWMEPRDLNAEQMNLIVNGNDEQSISSKHLSGANICYVGGEVIFLTNDFSESKLKQILISESDDELTSAASTFSIDRRREVSAKGEHLVVLDVSDSSEALKFLQKKTEVSSLRLRGTWNNTDGLLYLKDLPNLISLDILGGITDHGFSHLAELTNLVELYLASNALTDEGCVHLKGMTKLTTLSLGLNSRISGEGLVHLKDMGNLNSLDLRYTGLTDRGIIYLPKLKQLKKLYLSETKITDEGLGALKELTELQELWLEGTHVTEAGVEKLQKALPNCKITH